MKQTNKKQKQELLCPCCKFFSFIGNIISLVVSLILFVVIVFHPLIIYGNLDADWNKHTYDMYVLWQVLWIVFVVICCAAYEMTYGEASKEEEPKKKVTPKK